MTEGKHPLELLADYIEAVNTHLDSPVYSGALEEAMNDADDALLSLDPAALRAQAEADRGLREALAFYADTENYRGMGVPYLLLSTGEIEDDWGTIARDALSATEESA